MKYHADLTLLCIDGQASLQDAMRQINRNRLGIVLVVDEDRRLAGTVTDGDARRAILAHNDLAQPVSTILASKEGTDYAKPITAPVGADPATYISLLQSHALLHLPLLDETGRVAGLVRLDDFVSTQTPSVQAIVMAGGIGRRLRPLTEELPKPMLPIGDRPLMEIIIQQLRQAGITQITVTTHHKPNKIAEHFGDGGAFGVKLSYLEEDRPLGTAGGLGLVAPPQGTTLVMNGDILTQIDFKAMLTYHREHQADLTVAVCHYDFKVPYGVVECDGPKVRRLSEKPVIGLFVNAGIYLLEPVAFRFIPHRRRFEMPDLIHCLLNEHRLVVSFPICEYWIDVGEPETYQQAQAQVKGPHES